jgi:outer membrane receptor protein involved in Fe transport
MRSVGVLLLALCGGVAEAQDLPPAERAPRFLLASADASAPRAVDVRRTPMLRRRISVAFDGVTLREALSEISRQGNIPLMYSADDLPLDSRVRLRADSISVAGALSEVLLDAGVDVLMSADGRAALVRRAPVQVGTIVGRVTDTRAGTGLEQATVWVEGTSLRATTQVDGAYRIADVPSGTQAVSVRRLGYRRQSQAVVVVADQEVTADVALEAAATELEEVVVTGTMVETARRALPSPIAVITAEQIRENNIQRVDELFRGEIPGVVSFEEELNAGISRVFVRGASALSGVGEVKTYVDGVEVAEASFLSTIDPRMIDRIELIRGPQASTIYGSQALNGVLQIFTKKGVVTSRPTVEGSFSGGTIQTKWADASAAPTYRGNLTVAGGAEGFSYSVGGTRGHQGEWVTGFWATDQSVFGSFRATQGWLTAEFSGRLHTQNRIAGVLPYYAPFDSVRPTAKQQENNYQTTGVGVTLRARTTPFWEQAVTIGAERFLQEFVTVVPPNPGDSLQTFTAEVLHSSIRFTSSLQGVLGASLAGSFVAGVDLSAEKSTNSGGKGPYTTGSFPRNTFAGRFVSESRGYFAQGQLGIADRLFLTAGLRAEDDPYYGDDYGLAWAPRVGVSYVTDLGAVTLKPRFSYGKSIRPPFSTARLGSSTSTLITLPNPNIGPEAQQGFDAGIELYAGPRLSFQITYYDQDVTGLIDRVIDSVGPPQVRHYENIGKAKNRGVELEASIGLLRRLTLSGTYSLAESEVRKLSPDYTGALRVGQQILAVPRHSGGATLRYAGRGWTASVGARSLGSWNHYNLTAYYTCLYLATGCRNTTGSLADYIEPYSGFTKFRMGVSRQLNGRWTARLDVENLTNDYSVEELDTNTPIGRVATFGFDFRL